MSLVFSTSVRGFHLEMEETDVNGVSRPHNVGANR